MPQGTHIFRVRASNDDGVWNEEGASIRVTVLPPWWRTAWFRALVGGVRWRLYAVERRNAQLSALVAERTRELEESNRKLEEASLTDPLTGLRNRRFLDQHLEHHLSRSQRLRRDAATREERRDADVVFALLDIDHFKRVNDTHGHGVGDRVLVAMRDLLAATCRESDVIVRWGGEEFLVVCLFTSRDEAFGTAERLRAAVRGHAFEVGLSEPLRLSASVGAASYPFVESAPEWLSWEQVVALADGALYLAKAGGRDQTVDVVATPETDPRRAIESTGDGLRRMVAAGQLRLRSSRQVTGTEAEPK